MSESENEQRIGLFGGTFDPVHEGHLAIAQQVEKEVSLDQIIFIPAADPPHKQTTCASFKHRVAMLERALAGTADHVGLSLIEGERAAPSYTVDTLLELRKRLGRQRYYFILGADSLLELHLWYRFQDLPGLTNLIVIARPRISFQDILQAIAELPGSFVLQTENSQQLWRREDGAELIYLPEPVLDVASTTIRSQLAQGHCPDTLNSRVRDYIFDHKLYGAR